MKPRKKFERGQVAVIITLVIATLLGAMALGTDVALLYYNHGSLQRAGDLAAVAGAQQYSPEAPASPTVAAGCSGDSEEKVACTTALDNHIVTAEITNISEPASDEVEVDLQRQVPAFFSRVLGLQSFPVSTKSIAIAKLPTNSIGNGLFPAGMPPNPNGQSLTYGTTFQLTDDITQAGNWGWLDIPKNSTGGSTMSSAPSGGGAKTLGQNISSGCLCSVSVGQWLSTETGIQYGQVKQNVFDHIPNPGTTAPAESNLVSSDPELVTVPIVDWSQAKNGHAAVQVLGFAQVWLVNFTKSGNNEILTVQFVKFVNPNATSGSSSAPDYGSYFPAHLIS